MALHIKREVLDQIQALAQLEHPIEACGIVASSPGSKVACRLIPMKNQAASPIFFQFDSREQFRVFRELDDQDEYCRAIYHSHTASEAYPSREDLEYAGNPEAHYLIVSTWENARVPIRSFRLLHGKVIEENIVVLQ